MSRLSAHLLLALASAIAAGAGRADPASVVPADTLPADTLIDVGGRHLELEIRRGTDPVAVVFENGGGAAMEAWGTVPDSVSAHSGATIVRYNRAGTGRSELGPDTLTPAAEIRALIDALDALGIPRRRVIVGHSYGGLLSVVHADLDPEGVAGLVLVDAMNSRFIRATGDFIYETVPSYPEPADNAQRLIARMTRTLEDITARAHAVEPELRIPILVITAGTPFWSKEGIPEVWSQSHRDIAAAAPGRELVVAEGSRHQVPTDRPDLVVDAILRMISRAAE